MNKVKIYTTNTCPYCDMAKDYMKENKILYEEVNVESDESAAKKMIEKSGQMGVPVLEVNGEIIVGFNKGAIEKALKKK
jgi:glutaredoxin-like YruB-family protein